MVSEHDEAVEAQQRYPEEPGQQPHLDLHVSAPAQGPRVMSS